MYIEETNLIQVMVEPKFVPEQSFPEFSYYFFSYDVVIRNLSDTPVQLISRHWIVVDGSGRVENVKGIGVVGQQPSILPQTEYRYSSACPLRTKTGNMRGRYKMVNGKGEDFWVRVPLFFLRSNLSNQDAITAS